MSALPQTSPFHHTGSAAAGPPQQPHQANGPACDECRQRKVKCDRAQPKCGLCSRNGLSCGFSNRVKRVNHARQLVDDVAGLNERLDSIDGVAHQLMERMDTITELLYQPRRLGEQDDTYERGNHNDVLHQPVEQADNIAADAPKLVQSPSGLEHFYGSFSTHALLQTARKIVEALVRCVQSSQSNLVVSDNRTSTSQSIIKLSQMLDQSALPRVIRSFNTWSLQPYDEDDLKMQVHAFALPPIQLLEESLRHFFDETCCEWPIFNRASVLSAIQMQYASRQQHPDIAWSLCFNNIILMSISSRSELTGNASTRSSSAENGLLTSLINNAKLAFNLTPYLMSPRLINIQALLSLALVARDFTHYSTFERALSYAHQVANTMGLQEQYSREVTSELQDSERRDLLWTIYALDKQRCFIRGAPCLIYQFECSLDLPGHRDSMLGRYWPAQVQLTCIMEEIYRSLYSPKSKRQTTQQLEEGLRNCDRLLSGWSTRHSDLLDAMPNSGDRETLLPQQLKFSHHSCRIMVHRRGTSAENRHVCLESAREALNIVQVLALRASASGQEAVALRRIFNSCSVMAYYELWVHVLYSPRKGHTDDVALLVDVCKALGSLAHSAYPQAYCARVSKAIKWSTDMVQVIQDVKIPNDAMSPDTQLPTYSPGAQLGAWELLAPAFYGVSPYDYEIMDGGVITARGQSPANFEASLAAGRGFMTQSHQQVWPQPPDDTANTNASNAMDYALTGQSFNSTAISLPTGVESSLSMGLDMTDDQYYV